MRCSNSRNIPQCASKLDSNGGSIVNSISQFFETIITHTIRLTEASYAFRGYQELIGIIIKFKTTHREGLSVWFV